MKKITQAKQTFEKLEVKVKANGYEVTFEYPPIVFVSKTLEEVKELAEQYLLKPVVK